MSTRPESTVTTQLPSIDEVVAQFQTQKSAGAEAVQAAIDSTPPPPAKSLEITVDNEAAGATEPEVVEEPQVVKAVEEVVEEKKPEPKKDLNSSKFAAIARREREARAREKAIEDRMKEAEAREAALKAQEEKLAQVKKSPLKVLKEMGITLQDITQDALGEYKEPEVVVDPLDARLEPIAKQLEELKKMQERIDKWQADQAAEAQAAALQQVKDAIRETAQDEKYELIQQFGDEAVDFVKDVIQEYWNQNQKLLDYSEACDIVEGYYEENLIGKILNTKKVQSRFAPAASEPKKDAPKPAPKEVRETPTTLTNTLNTATQATIDVDKMSRDEAIAYLSKQLVFKQD